MSPPQAECPLCRAEGRYSSASEQHAYCRLCGEPLRKAAFVADGVPLGSQACWLVAPGGVGRVAHLSLRNVGSLPLHLEQALAQPAPHVTVECTPQELAPGEEAPIVLRLATGAGEQPQAVKLLARGNFRAVPVTVHLQPGPAQVRAQHLAEDVWSRQASQQERLAPRADPPAAASHDRVVWRSTLAVMPWMSDGQVEFDVCADTPASTVQPKLPPARGTPSWAPAEPVTAELAGADEAGRTLRVRLRIDPSRLVTDVQGVLTIELQALGRPRIEVLLHLLHGRPEFQATRQSSEAACTLPAGLCSRLRLALSPFMPERWRAGLASHVRDVHVRASAVAGRANVTSQASYRSSPATGQGIVHLDVTPGEEPGPLHVEVSSEVELTGGERGPAQARTLGLDLKVRSHDHWTARGSSQNLAVDFGTTHTCVTPFETGATVFEAMRVPGLGKEEDPLIPTLVLVRNPGRPGRPDLVAGEMARKEEAERFALGQACKVHAGFKPKVGLGPDGDTHDDDLARWFLEELILSARERLGNAPLEGLYLTYPTAFSIQQRQALERIAERLRAMGIVGAIELALDEGTAAAFDDVYHTLLKAVRTARPACYTALTIDIGGGTTDIAVLQVRRPEHQAGQMPEADVYRMLPLGLTGIRDFGGSNVTEAMTCLMERQFATLHARQPYPWLPLPGDARIEGPHAGPEERAAALANRDFLRDIAQALKESVYGNWGALRTDDELDLSSEDWHASLKTGLLPEGLDAIHLHRLTRKLHVVERAGARPRAVLNPKSWLGKICLTRDAVDAVLEPAIVEAFQRATRLLDATTQEGPRSPDQVFFSGGSCQLPLLWKLAARPVEAGGLGKQPGKIKFKVSRAKRKTCEGAALFLCAKGLVGSLRFEDPPTPQDFVLVPIVVQTASTPHRDLTAYEGLFGAGHLIPGTLETAPTAGDVQRTYHPPPGKVSVHLFENVDLRTTVWRPEATDEASAAERHLHGLGLRAGGKEKLCTVQIAFPPGATACEATFSIRKEAHGRTLYVNLAPGERQGPFRI
ncbi:MAG: hypothetical protein ACKOCB_03940 [Planctomycetia bacterium]